jgi:hypothetical protein
MASVPAHPPLARAYLALADDPEPLAAQRSLPRIVLALLAAAVLALAPPLAWAAGEPRDAPAATAVKAGQAEDDDGGDDDDGPAGAGDPWAATNA